mgnify:CR=1 FL=1
MGGISFVAGGETDKIILCFVSVGHQSMKAWLCIDHVILSCNHKQKNFQHYLLKPSCFEICITCVCDTKSTNLKWCVSHDIELLIVIIFFTHNTLKGHKRLIINVKSTCLMLEIPTLTLNITFQWIIQWNLCNLTCTGRNSLCQNRQGVGLHCIKQRKWPKGHGNQCRSDYKHRETDKI